MRFARYVLIIQAVIMIAFSLAYWVRPYEMANLNGMLLMETASVSHMRVYYGGLQLGLALFLLWALRGPDRTRPALMMLVFTMGALAAGRLGSLWLDGGALAGFDLASFLYRVLAAVLAGAALMRIRGLPDVEPERIEPAARRLATEPPKPFQLGEMPPATDPVMDGAPRPFRRGDPVD